MGTLKHILFDFCACKAKKFVRFKHLITILGIKILLDYLSKTHKEKRLFCKNTEVLRKTGYKLGWFEGTKMRNGTKRLCFTSWDAGKCHREGQISQVSSSSWSFWWVCCRKWENTCRFYRNSWIMCRWMMSKCSCIYSSRTSSAMPWNQITKFKYSCKDSSKSMYPGLKIWLNQWQSSFF